VGGLKCLEVLHLNGTILSLEGAKIISGFTKLNELYLGCYLFICLDNSRLMD
jgi:hypothetical protein